MASDNYARYFGPGAGGGGGGSGTVTSVSVVSAHGLAGTVATPTTTPAITLSTTITGILQGNGTAITAATTGDLTDTGTDGITIGSGSGAVLGSGTTISQHVADTTHNGYLSSTDWNTFNNKQPTITEGNLTEATSSVLTISGGTSAVIGSGTSIQVKQASTSVSGYLSSTDWNTFNGKQASGNYITALTGDVSASGPGSVASTLATVNSNIGSFGSSTAIPSFTVNGKGLITVASTNVVIAPAGTLSGTTLNSTVVTSSLTSVGTITTGVWNGTPVDISHGGTNNGSLAVTAGGVIYTDGSKLVNVGAGSSGNFLKSNGASAPTWEDITTAGSSPTVQKFTSGSGTYTLPTNPSPLYIRVEMVGGGGGGAGTNAGATGGGAGGNTTFGTSLLTANGGSGNTAPSAGGAGGSASLGSGPIGTALTGGSGSGANGVVQASGANGGNNPFGGGGGGGYGTVTPTDGQSGPSNTGAGGGGGGGDNVSGGGAGGGAGGYINAIITSPSSTYSYAVGAAGTAGAAGSGGANGGAGGSGVIIVTEYYAPTNVNLVAPGTSGNVLTSNGSVWTSAAPAKTFAAQLTMNGGSSAVVSTFGGSWISYSSYSTPLTTFSLSGFSSTPWVTATVYFPGATGGAAFIVDIQAISNSSITFGCFNNSGSEALASTFHVMLMAVGT